MQANQAATNPAPAATAPASQAPAAPPTPIGPQLPRMDKKEMSDAYDIASLCLSEKPGESWALIANPKYEVRENIFGYAYVRKCLHKRFIEKRLNIRWLQRNEVENIDARIRRGCTMALRSANYEAARYARQIKRFTIDLMQEKLIVDEIRASNKNWLHVAFKFDKDSLFLENWYYAKYPNG